MTNQFQYRFGEASFQSGWWSWIYVRAAHPGQVMDLRARCSPRTTLLIENLPLEKGLPKVSFVALVFLRTSTVQGKLKSRSLGAHAQIRFMKMCCAKQCGAGSLKSVISRDL